jgi:hypothetical protein
MLKKQKGNTITERIVCAATKAGRVKTVLATVTIASVLSVIAYVFQMRWWPARPQAPPAMPEDAETQTWRDSTGASLLDDASVVGRIMAQTDPNKISAPSVGFSLGRRPGEADDPDLSTPATAVHEVLALIDRGATDQLRQCSAPGAQDVAGGLYPRYVGHPVEVVEVAEEGAAGKVLWKATVHAGFTLEGRSWSAGETITLETRLIQVEGTWKLARLYEHHP